MDFIHHSYQPGETIAAIATPPGEGGVAIVRISGKGALKIGAKLFSGPLQSYLSHTAHFGSLLNANRCVIDQGLALVMKGPRSYTGEDTVEFHCHGGVLISRKVLAAALAAGARAAMPGEFTFQAFQNGKIDLTQAEAVQQLIGARSERAYHIAKGQLKGSLSRAISAFQKELLAIGAWLEALVDFPEEGLDFQSKQTLNEQIKALLQGLEALSHTFHDGKRVQTGIKLCLVGAVNVGKSSLMNALLCQERAIVTSIAGTTRDLIEEELLFGNLLFRLIDTAGRRNAAGVIEKEGIKRSIAAAKDADLVLIVLDVTAPLPPLLELEKLVKDQTVLIWNKTDLPHKNPPSLPFPHQVRVSAKEGVGLEELKKMIETIAWRGELPSNEEVVITSERHFNALQMAIKSVQKVRSGLEDEVSPEFLASDLRLALSELGTIIGMNITEDLLSAIFSTFCVGK